MVEIVNAKGRTKRVNAKLARALVKMGRFSYLTTAIAEPFVLPASAAEKVEQIEYTAEKVKKKPGRPKKLKDADADTP